MCIMFAGDGAQVPDSVHYEEGRWIGLGMVSQFVIDLAAWSISMSETSDGAELMDNEQRSNRGGCAIFGIL